MKNAVSFFLLLPFKAFGKMCDFLVWDVLSNGHWREKHVSHTNPVGILQGETIYLRSLLRQKDAERQQEIAALQRKHRQELDDCRRHN